MAGGRDKSVRVQVRTLKRPGEAALAVRALGLRKQYGTVEALREIDLSIPSGELYGFVGPNGAGKTTAIRILTGLTRPTKGAAEIFGSPAGSPEARARVGYMPQELALYLNLSAWENVALFGRLYGMNGEELDAAVEEQLRFVDLWERRHGLVSEFSGGMRHRVSLAAALVHRPDLLLLDEPTVGIDPVLRAAFWERFRVLAREGRTIFLTTHYLQEASHCHRVGFLLQGQLLAEAAPEALQAQAGARDLEEAFLTFARQVEGAAGEAAR